MKTYFNPKNNPRVIIIQKLYGKFFNENNVIEFPKHRFKKFIKETVLGTIERNDLIIDEINNNIEESVSDWISTITSKSPNAIASGLKSFENIYVNKKIIGKLNDELQKLKESDDFIEGIKSLREKRKPTWKKP